MALEIRSIPVLTGETAERFVREAEENERNPQTRKVIFSFVDFSHSPPPHVQNVLRLHLSAQVCFLFLMP